MAIKRHRKDPRSAAEECADRAVLAKVEQPRPEGKRSRVDPPYRLPDHSFGGEGERAGLVEGLGEIDWARIRDLADPNRGS